MSLRSGRHKRFTILAVRSTRVSLRTRFRARHNSLGTRPRRPCFDGAAAGAWQGVCAASFAGSFCWSVFPRLTPGA